MEENEGEISRQRELLDVPRPEIKTHKADSLAVQLFICEEEVPPEKQERSPSLVQEEPEPLQIKEEQEDIFQDLEEADASKMTLHPVKCENDGENTLSSQLSQIQDPELLQIKDELRKGMKEANHSKITVLPVKCEDGQENSGPFPLLQIKIEEKRETKPQTSTYTEQMETQPGGEDCGVSEPASNLVLASNLEPTRDGQLLSSDCSRTETETDNSDELEESGGPRSGLKTLQSKKTQKTLCLSKATTSTEQMETQPGEEDRRVSQPAYNLDKAGDLEPTRDGQPLSSDCSETDDSDECEETDYSNEWGLTDDSNEWGRTGEPQSGSNTLKSKKSQKNGQSLSNSNMFKSSVGSSQERKLSNQILSETWSCKVCGKCFPIRHSLAVHVRVHPSDCGLCGKHLEPAESLNLHLQTHRTCTVCGKRCTTGTEFERHMRSHTGEKPYGCTLCHKRFVRKGQLTVHWRSHTGERPYSCTLCRETFSQQGHMTLHLRSHTGERPYSCTLCHKTYVKQSKLTIHLRSHTGEKPYSCTLCHERFSRKENLNRHLRIHTVGKQFSCTLCHKRFGRKEYLNRHLRSHSGGKEFSCTVCGKGFNRKQHVERHMKIHTGEKPDSVPPDPPQLSVCEEEVPPEQQERSPSLGQDMPEPLQIKKEPEELWTSQEGEQLQGLEEGDIIKFTFNPVPVKSEHDEEKPQSSWFNETQDPESLQIKEEQEELFQDLEESI